MQATAAAIESGSYFVWEPPNRCLKVLLNVRAIDSMRASMDAALAAGEETGGLLLGHVDQAGSPLAVVTIDDYEPVPIRHRRGLGYTLEQRDRTRLAKRISDRGASDGQIAVGLVRSHMRQGVYLDSYDVALFRHFFSSTTSVFLVVRPGAEASAGFFFWEESELRSHAPYEVFPFDAAALARTRRGLLLVPRTPAVQQDAAAQHRRAIIAGTAGDRKQRMLLGGVAATTFALILAAALYPARKEEAVTPPTRAARAQRRVSDAATVTETAERMMPAQENPAPQERVAIPRRRHARVRKLRLARYTVPPATITAVPKPAREEHGLSPVSLPAIAVAPGRPPIPAAPVLPPAIVTVSYRKAPEPVLRKTIGRVPLLGSLPGLRFRGGDRFVPARASHEVEPEVPASIAAMLTGERRVQLRASVDEAGKVTDVELLSRTADHRLFGLADTALRHWNFNPATMKGRPVSSRVIVTFDFQTFPQPPRSQAASAK